MRKGCFILFFLLLSVGLYAHDAECGNCRKLGFKENKGQWPAEVLFKAEMLAGSVYIERNAITFHMLDTALVRAYRTNRHHNFDYQPEEVPAIPSQAFQLRFMGANMQHAVLKQEQSEARYNYFIGSDPKNWASNVYSYGQIVFPEIYAGIDLRIYSDNGNLKYDWIVKPGADPAQIRIGLFGVPDAHLSGQDLILPLQVNKAYEMQPYCYQAKQEVACQFRLNNQRLTYAFPEGYNRNDSLIIDPTVIFSTYSGSFADNFGYTATYDSKGNLYAGSSVFGDGYPFTSGAFDTTWSGGFGTPWTSPPIIGTDIAISKYAADGSVLLFSTYLGGMYDELPHSLYVNKSDEVFMLGTTSSPNFPVTTNAFDTSFNGGDSTKELRGLGVSYNKGSDIVVVRLKVDGSALKGSTYVGGSKNDGLNLSYHKLKYNYADEVRGEILLDENDNVYIASSSYSFDFPVSVFAIQPTPGGNQDAVVFKMDNDLTTMIWSTYWGGSDDDAAYSLEFGINNDLYFAGGTRSSDFPTTAGALFTSYQGGRSDGFITDMNENGTFLISSTLFGSDQYDQIYMVEKDRSGNVYAYGQTMSVDSSVFIFNAAYHVIGGKMFVVKLTPDLDARIWSTALGSGGGRPDLSPTAFLVDLCNSVYLSGWGGRVNWVLGSDTFGEGNGNMSGQFISAGAIQATTDNSDFYIMVLKDDASAATYGTYYGGSSSWDHVDGGTSRFDRKGIIYEAVCASCGGSSDFPIVPAGGPVVSATNNAAGGCNNAVFKIDFNLPIVVADFIPEPVVCLPDSVHFINTSKDSTMTTYSWSFGDGSISSDENPVHLYPGPGIYNVKLVIFDPQSCNLADSIEKQIIILSNSRDSLSSVVICDTSSSVQIGLPPLPDTSITYQWIPSAGLSRDDVANPIAHPAGPATYMLIISNGLCFDTLIQRIDIFDGSLTLTGGTTLCPRDTICLHVENDNPSDVLSYNWSPNSYIVSGDFTADPCVVPIDTTTFYVIATNDEGCKFMDSIRVNVSFTGPRVYAYADPDTVDIGSFTQLSEIDTDAVSIQWLAEPSLNDPNISNPIATPTQTTTYVVEATDANGCKSSDSVTVYVQLTPCPEATVFIPSGFSPNADGKNDFLFVRGHSIEELYFAVYDRWGQMVFETRDKNVGWNGEFKGKKLDPAVFGWYVEGKCVESGEKFKHKGNVTLMR